MHWSVVPFGKYKGKTLPEIIVLDLDWFFWVLPKLYGKLAEEARELARKAHAIKIPRRGRRIWRSSMSLTWTTGFAGLGSSRLTAPFAMDNETFIPRLGVASSPEI